MVAPSVGARWLLLGALGIASILSAQSGAPNRTLTAVPGIRVGHFTLKVRPSADCGNKAATTATTGAVIEGSVGAGAGATVGKLGAFSERTGSPAASLRSTKAGLGSAAIALPSGLIVAAIVAVNAVGDI